MRDYTRIKVWDKAHGLALAVYGATAGFPKEEAYGLTSQMRRSAVSIPANIAQGSGRGGTVEFGRFLHIAAGSASELEYSLRLAHDLGLLTSEDYGQHSADTVEVKKMLRAYANSLHQRD